MGRDRLTKQKTIEMDLDYVRNRGLSLDLQILWKTFIAVITCRDAM
jgi:lipopolysaccharide/colanic/teichoic acid biosynthesis glycosyltransferase